MKALIEIDDPRIVKAFANPLRVRIHAILKSRPASPSELAKELGTTVKLVSYHVHMLEKYGQARPVGRVPGRRGSVAHQYEATGRPVVSDEAWSRVPRVVREAHEAALVEQVIDYLKRAQGEGGFKRAESHITRTPMMLDARGFRELATELKALFDTAERIKRESAERLKDCDHEGEISAGLVMAFFEATDFGSAPHSSPSQRDAKSKARRAPART